MDLYNPFKIAIEYGPIFIVVRLKNYITTGCYNLLKWDAIKMFELNLRTYCVFFYNWCIWARITSLPYEVWATAAATRSAAVTNTLVPGCLSQPATCALPFLAQGSPFSTLHGCETMGAGLALVGWSEIENISLSYSGSSSHAQGYWWVPTDGISKNSIPCYPFFSFLTFFFTTLTSSFSTLVSFQTSNLLCFLFSLCFQFCVNCAHIWILLYSYLGNLSFIGNCWCSYLGSAGLVRLFPKICPVILFS